MYLIHSTNLDLKSEFLGFRYGDTVTPTIKHINSITEFSELIKGCDGIVLEHSKKNKPLHNNRFMSKKKTTTYATRTKDDLTERPNMFMIDFDPEEHTEQQILAQIDQYNFPNYLLYRSSSYFLKGKTNRYHLWVMTDRNYQLKEVRAHLFNLTDDKYVQQINFKLKTTLFDVNVYHSARMTYIPKLAHTTYIIKEGPAYHIHSKHVQPKQRPNIVKIRPQSDHKARGTFYLSDKLLGEDGKLYTVQEILKYKKDTIRYTSPTNDYANSKMQYFPKTQTFHDYSDEDHPHYKVSLTETKVVEYNTDFNHDFRPLTNTPINTLEISPTGSGKTHTYKDTPKTIMIMPTNALVSQQDNYVLAKTPITELQTTTMLSMTYNKFFGHVDAGFDFSAYNIIVDEAHNLIKEAGLNDQVENLFTRQFTYKELKLMSATIMPEMLELYPMQLSTVRYINTTKKPRYIFTSKMPVLNKKERTIIFKDDIRDLSAMYDEAIASGFKPLLITSGDVVPRNIDEYNLVLATRVMREGVSIDSIVHTIILINQTLPAGGMHIAQYAARPRKNSPTMYVVCANSHYTKPETLVSTLSTYEWVVQQDKTGEDQHLVNTALNLNVLLAKAKPNGVYNRAGLIDYFMTKRATYELHVKEAMEDILKYYSNAIVEFHSPLQHTRPARKSTKLMERVRACTTFIELSDLIDLLALGTTEEKKVSSKLNKLDPITSVAFKGRTRHLTEEVQVQTITTPLVRKQIKNHNKNLYYKVYEQVNRFKKPWKVGDTPTQVQKQRRLKALVSPLKVFKDIDQAFESIYLATDGCITSTQQVHEGMLQKEYELSLD